jgi:hypothetical protein
MLAFPKKSSGRRQRADKSMLALPKAAPAVRDEPYRMLVATLECFHCRIWKHSQAAHPNSGKAKGAKADDRLAFPLCCVSGRDCHRKFDHYELMPAGPEMIAFEAAAHRWTVTTLLERGLWPLDRPIPDIRSFQ